MQFSKNYGKCEKTYRYHVCNNPSKKELFGVRTKLSYNKDFFRIFIGNRNEKIQIFLNKPVYLDLSMSEISKIVMYEFSHDYVKPKYGENAKLCYTNTESFIVSIKTEDICLDSAKKLKQNSRLQIMH